MAILDRGDIKINMRNGLVLLIPPFQDGMAGLAGCSVLTCIMIGAHHPATSTTAPPLLIPCTTQPVGQLDFVELALGGLNDDVANGRGIKLYLYVVT